eukprot:3751654-Pleurochrysis_carterae.AAC.1
MGVDETVETSDLPATDIPAAGDAIDIKDLIYDLDAYDAEAENFADNVFWEDTPNGSLNAPYIA